MNPRAVEKLAGEGDHAVHEVGLDEVAADVSFAGLVGGHAAIGEDEAGHVALRFGHDLRCGIGSSVRASASGSLGWENQTKLEADGGSCGGWFG